MEKLFGAVLAILFIQRSQAFCYFPQEVQGDFIMQSTANSGNGIQYSTINITENSISIWGNCHRRIGNNYILMFNYSNTSCIRCLHLKLRSSNVLQVFASSHEIMSNCFTNEEVAEKNCPSDEALLTRETAEILLFKTKDVADGLPRKEYCPIDGKFFLNYHGSSAKRPSDCLGLNSTLDSCPSGSTLNFRLRGCSSDNYEFQFDCLGYWRAGNGETFMVFTDSRHLTGQKPKYRCALYRQNKETGNIDMALSSDSTCTTDLYNSSNGFETYTLVPKGEDSWPAEIYFGMCTFPKWMHGNWEHIRIDEKTMVYKDHTSFKTYTIKCVQALEEENKYLIFSRTQCNEERYNCMKIANRSNNILEFQLGINFSLSKSIFTLCNDENFMENSWITQGRADIYPEMVPGLCPIKGEYTGHIPDAEEFCAKLWSDCRAPELMYYQVSNCANNEILEEREYQCLGHWRESQLLYTYTQRRDVAAPTYECFVGSIISDSQIYIKEAGGHCQRGVNPVDYGMKLTKKNMYSCITRDTTTRIPMRFTTPKAVSVQHYTTPPTKRTTIKQWNFDNTIPETEDDPRSKAAFNKTSLILCIVMYIMTKNL